MEEKNRLIKDLSIQEREDLFADIARDLEDTSHEAYVEGRRHFAAFSANMAQAIRINAGELARDDVQGAERVLQQATAVISNFHAGRPYRMISHAIH